MVSSKSGLLSVLLLSCILLLNHQLVECGDGEDNLIDGINKYRSSLNLSTLTKNDNAECLADKMADQFKNQPCTNSTGANTVPGTEPLFSNYPVLLSECHLNISNTRDGSVMPACVPGLVPSVVLANFTQSQYSEYLNDTKFSGIGIGSEGDWIVAVLTTSTPDGSFAPYSAAYSVYKMHSVFHWIFWLLGSILLFWEHKFIAVTI